MRGAIISYAGQRYAGIPYLLVETPGGTVYWIKRPEGMMDHFKMMNTVTFTPCTGQMTLKKFEDPLCIGEDPAEAPYDPTLPPFMTGVIMEYKGGKGRIMANTCDHHL